MKKPYIVQADAWLYGKLYTKGSEIELTDKQAKYELLSGTIVSKEAVYQPKSFKTAKPAAEPKVE